MKSIYKITWLDIQAHNDRELSKPYKQYLCERQSIGYLEEDNDVTIVIYLKNIDQENSGKEMDFIAIPKILVIKSEKIYEETSL